MLIRKIEEYNLDKYDRGVPVSMKNNDKKDTLSEKPSVKIDVSPGKNGGNTEGNNFVAAVRPRVMEKNRIQYVIVNENDTPESLEKEFQLLKWELTRYNELEPGFKCTPGQILYLQPKRDKADFGSDFHTVSQGDTMYSISQIYGIKLKSLLNMNRMKEGEDPVLGQKIWLRSVKPVD
jgi:LysM repeat protein